MATIGTLRANLLTNVAAFERDMGRAQKSVGAFGRKMGKAGGQIRSVGTSMTIGLTLPILGVATAAVKMATGFNKAMADVATLIPKSTGRVRELKSAVQEMAVAHGKDTTDLAKGLYQTISAFGDVAGQTVKVLEINSRAAAAGLATTEQAIALTSSVTKAYGDTSARAVQRVADLAFQTVKLGQTTFPELAASMGRVVPIAAKLGVTQEELSATFATLTGVTGNTADVSTQMSAVLRAMIKPTATMTDSIKKLGFANSEAMTRSLGMVGSLDALIGTTDGTNESVGKLFGRAEALNAVFALTGAQAETFTTKLGAMGEVTGAADEAFDEVTQGINKAGFAWNQFKASVVVTAQRLGDELLPILMDVAERLKPIGKFIVGLVKTFAGWSTATKTAVVGLLGLLAAIGPVLVVLGTLALSLSAVMGVITGGLITIGGLITALGVLSGVAIAVGVALGAWKLLKWVRDISTYGKGVEKILGTLTDLEKQTTQNELSWRKLSEVTKDADRAMKNVSDAFVAGTVDIFDLDGVMRNLAESGQLTTGRMKQLAEMAQTLSAEDGILTVGLERLIATYGRHVKVTDEVTASLFTMTEAQKKTAAAVRARADNEHRLMEIVSRGQVEMEKTGKVLAEMGTEWVSIVDISERIPPGLEGVFGRMNEGLETVPVTMADVGESTRQLESDFGLMGQAIEGTFAQMMIGAKGFKDGFIDIWQSIKASFSNILAKMLKQFLGGFLNKIMGKSSGLGGMFGGGGGKRDGGGGFLSDIFGGIFGSGTKAGAGGAATSGGGLLSKIFGGGLFGGGILGGLATGGILTAGTLLAKPIFKGIKKVGSAIGKGIKKVGGFFKGLFGFGRKKKQQTAAPQPFFPRYPTGIQTTGAEGPMAMDASFGWDPGMFEARHGLVGDFGKATPIIAHGLEAIVPLDEFMSLTGPDNGGSDAADLGMLMSIRDILEQQPRVIARAVRDAVLQAVPV